MQSGFIEGNIHGLPVSALLCGCSSSLASLYFARQVLHDSSVPQLQLTGVEALVISFLV